jgi:hypothetical protein
MRTLSARRALLHPAWLAAAGVLLVNDHVLKGSSIVPAVVTGKLSDFAGLFLVPALASTLVFARSRRAVMAVHVLVAVAFAAVKTVPALTIAFEHFLSLFVASRVWTDPTDLVALPAILLSWRLLVPRMEDGAQTAVHVKVAQLAACSAGALMCIATSQEVQRPLSIQNLTKQKVTVTIRALSTDVRVDDPIFFSNTPLPLSPTLFAPAIGGGVLSLDPGKAMDSNALGARVLLVDIEAGGKGSQIVLARSPAITAFDIVTKADGTFAVSSDGASIRNLDAVKPCAAPPLKGTDYTILLPTQGTISHISDPIEGCFDLSFVNGNERAHVCMPREAWPFGVGDAIEARAGEIVGIANGAEIHIAFEMAKVQQVTVDLSCGAVDSCGTIGFDTVVELSDGVKVRSGADHRIGNTRWLVGRAESLPVVNTTCKDVFGNKAAGLQTSLVRIETQSVMGSDAGADGGGDAAGD